MKLRFENQRWRGEERIRVSREEQTWILGKISESIKGFIFTGSGLGYSLAVDELRQIADKLDELNKGAKK